MDAAGLKDLFERRRRALIRRPSLARAAVGSRVRAVAGGAGRFEERGAALLVDLPADEGGRAEVPDPAQLLRASIGASLALGTLAWAARNGVPVAGVEVEVSCEWDARGALGVAGIPSRWRRVVLHVQVASAAPERDVWRLVRLAERSSAALGNLSPAVHRVRRLTIQVPAVQGTERSVAHHASITEETPAAAVAAGRAPEHPETNANERTTP